MRRMLTLAAGGAVGYVLGARAGHQRYEQIKGAAGSVAQKWPRNESGRPVLRPSSIREQLSGSDETSHTSSSTSSYSPMSSGIPSSTSSGGTSSGVGSMVGSSTRSSESITLPESGSLIDPTR